MGTTNRFNLRKRSELHISSKSNNTSVSSLYNKILKNTDSDSDFWYLMGADELLDLLYDFNDKDISELKTDLKYWTSNELEIFANALDNDYSNSHSDLRKLRVRLHELTIEILKTRTTARH